MSDVNEQGAALLEIEREIERAARHMVIEWPEVVDSWEDMATEIRLRLMSDNYAIKVRDMDPKPRRVVLAKIGGQLASGMREDYERFNGNFRYSTQEVRQLLEKGALESPDAIEITIDIDDGTDGEQTWTIPADADGREVMGKTTEVEPFDIRAAFATLTDKHQAILLRNYVLRETLAVNDRRNLTRAVDAMTTTMNRGFRRAVSEFEGVGSRPVTSNAQAVNATRTAS